MGDKRRDYAAMGVGEYWRFDETGQYHGVPMAGERLVDGECVATELEELPDDSLQGYSAVLDLNIRWKRSELRFYDLGTGRPIATLEHERARAAAVETERNAEREARVRELEELLRRQNP